MQDTRFPQQRKMQIWIIEFLKIDHGLIEND